MERELDKTFITKSHRFGPAESVRLASVKPNINFSQHKCLYLAD